MTSAEGFDLEELGWDRFFAAAFDARDDTILVPARCGH